MSKKTNILNHPAAVAWKLIRPEHIAPDELEVLEAYGGGKQMLKYRSWPKFSIFGNTSFLVFAGLFVAAIICQAWIVGSILGTISLIGIISMLLEYSAALVAFDIALRQLSGQVLLANTRYTDNLIFGRLLTQTIQYLLLSGRIVARFLSTLLNLLVTLSLHIGLLLMSRNTGTLL